MNNEVQKVDDSNNDKPALLKAVEIILAKTSEIKKAADSLHERYKSKYMNKKKDDVINDMVARKLISNYSYYAAFTGGTTALTGVIPGLGTLVAAFGGATADIALSMKFQIEMTMAIAVIYGHDITTSEEQRLCFIIAGLGAINKAAKEGGKTVGSKAFVKMAQQYLKGPLLQTVKEIFKKIGITFTRKALEKAIPFGVGVVIGYSANKGLAVYIGKRAMAFFKVH